MKRLLTGVLKGLGFSEYFVWLFLRELRLLRVRVFATLSLRQRAAINRARKMTGLKVNLACGQVASEGWTGIDSSFQSKADWYLDLRAGLPLADQSCSHLFCEHFLEHLTYPEEALRFLAECYRVLEPGGILRAIVPDAGKFAQVYAVGDSAFLQEASPDSSSPMEALNVIFHGAPLGEHHYAYDFDTMAPILKSVGFRHVVLRECGEGGPASTLDRQDAPRALESLYVEAVK